MDPKKSPINHNWPLREKPVEANESVRPIYSPLWITMLLSLRAVATSQSLGPINFSWIQYGAQIRLSTHRVKVKAQANGATVTSTERTGSVRADAGEDPQL